MVNGIPDNPEYAEYETALVKAIKINPHDAIDYFVVRDMNIHFCTGCWDCWLKTPGLCALKDDQEQILSRAPHADLILFISPVILGYESALLKKVKDRLIPIVHPYIRVYKGEQHHLQRYTKSPNISVLLMKHDDTTSEDLKIIRHAYERVALNYGSSVTGFHVIENAGGVENVLHHL